MQKTKRKRRSLLSLVLALVMVFSTFTGIMPGTGMKAEAASHIGLVYYEEIAANDVLVNNFISYRDEFEYSIDGVSKGNANGYNSSLGKLFLLSGKYIVESKDATHLNLLTYSLSVDKTSITFEKEGDELGTEQLTATISPGIAPQTLKWESSNTGVATVDEKGLVTGISKGVATITVTATSGTDITRDDVSATCKVMVETVSDTWDEDFTYSGDKPFVGNINVTNDITLTIPEGKTLTVNGTINATGKTLTVKGKGNLLVTGDKGAEGDNAAGRMPASGGNPGGDGFKGDLIVNGANVTITGGDGGKGGDATAGSGANGGNGGNAITGSITVNKGEANLTGGNGGNGGSGRRVNGKAGTKGKAVTGTITTNNGTAQESDNGTDWTDISSTTSTKQYVNVTGSVVANKVIDMIDALPAADKVKPEDKTDIQAARAAYDALDDSDKDDVTNYENLTSDELALNKSLFDAYKADKKTVAEGKGKADDSDAAKSLIAAVTSVIDTLTYDEDKTLEENKAMVDAVISTLDAGLETQREIDAVINAINGLPEIANITTSDKTAIKAARTAYDKLTDDQKKMIPAETLKKLMDAEDKLLELATELTNESKTWDGDSKITKDVTIDGGVTINTDMTLIIPEGKTLTVNGGINAGEYTLTVTGKGKFIVNGVDGIDSDEYAGSGSTGFAGNLSIDGVSVAISGGKGGSGGTGGAGGVGVSGNIVINSGKVTVMGGDAGHDSWSTTGSDGVVGVDGNVTVKGGSFTAIGGNGMNGVDNGGNGGAGVNGKVIVEGGSASMAGGSCGGGDEDSGKNGKAVTGTITGPVINESDDNDTWTIISGATSTKQYIKVIAADYVQTLIAALPDTKDVKKEHKDAIEAARKSYDMLDETEQAKVTNYSRLTDAELALAKLEAKAEVDKLLEGKVEEEYDTDDWKAMNKAITDAETAIDAVTDISKISEAKETAINAAKAVIDATKTKAEKLAAAKTEATTELDDLLNGKKQEDYDAEDWTAINTAITNGKTAIEGATDVAGVTSAKETATNTVATIKTIAEKELEAAKQEATAELDALLDGKKEADYDAEDWTAIQDAITTAKNNIAKATTKDAVDNATQTAKETVGTKKTKTEKLADAKTEAKAALDKLLTEKKQSDYDEAEWDALTQAVADGKDLVDNATDIAGVNTAKTEVETSVGEIKTKAQKLADAKETAKKALDELLKGKSANDYDEEEWAALNKAVTEGKVAIDKAADEAGVNEAKEAAITSVEAVKTKADKELEAAKEAAKAELNALLSNENKAKYDAEEWKAVEAAVKEGIDNIDKAKNTEEIKAAADAAKTAVDAVKTIAEKAAEKDAADKVAADKVIEAINKLPASDKVATTDKAAIEAARKAYNDLTDDQEAKVPADVLKKLTDAEDALKKAEQKAADTDKKDSGSDTSKKDDKADTAAKNVVDAINKLPVSSKVTTANKAAIEAARKAYNGLSPEQKKNIPADVLKMLTDDEKALAAAEKKAAEEKAAKELAVAKAEAQAAMNSEVTVTQKGKKITLKWTKSASADGYDVYVQYCGSKATKPVKTIKKNTTTKATIKKINGKKINLKKNFHAYIEAYKMIDGKKVVLGKSNVGHVVGAKNSKYTNVKSIKLTKKSYTVKVGKTTKVKARITLVDKSKKHISKAHGAKFRYKSSDTSIATVSKKGKIKGIKKGTCTIYVYAINGKMKKAKVTVK